MEFEGWGSGVGVQGSGQRVEGEGFGVQGLRFMVQGVVFEDCSFELRARGSGFRKPG